PSTGQDAVSQFVRLTLTLTLDPQVRRLLQTFTCLQLEAASCLGSPVLYQLIEKAKEILTDSNIPHGNCVICLYDFKEGEAFTKTSCYHYFHSHCLGRYVSHSEEELQQREKELEEDKTRERTEHQLTVVCPVCREALTYDLDLLLLSPAPQLPETFGSDFQRKWEGLQKILEKQRSKGGIIDPEVESNRFLIHINEVRAHSDVHASLPQHPKAAPITEHLDKLSLAADCPEAPLKTKPQLGSGHRDLDLGRSRTEEKEPAAEREVQVSSDHQEALRSAMETDCLKDGAGSAGGRGHRGRRRGPYRPIPHAGPPGPGRHHWDGRAPRSRGGANNLYGSGGGHRRGHGRGFQQRVVERGREEVL
uniref:Ring finger protein 25 n=1 Tax=Oryzias melastigma TaxID=30732 RepID=A0A3B3C924_ORYME